MPKNTLSISGSGESAKRSPLPLPCKRGLDIHEAADYLGIKSRLLRSYVGADLIMPFRLGGVASKRPNLLFDLRDLDMFIDEVKQAGGVDSILDAKGSGQ